MILAKSYLRQNQMGSGTLSGLSLLRPNNHKAVRPMIFTLALTSLIDAFSILVIFLLIQGPSGQKEVNIGKEVQLPTVKQFVPLDQGVAVRIEKGRYFIEDQEVTTSDLVRRLYDIRQNLIKTKAPDNKSLIVQADKRSDFESINPIIQAGAQIGFEQIKFAVLPRKGS